LSFSGPKTKTKFGRTLLTTEQPVFVKDLNIKGTMGHSLKLEKLNCSRDRFQSLL